MKTGAPLLGVSPIPWLCAGKRPALGAPGRRVASLFVVWPFAVPPLARSACMRWAGFFVRAVVRMAATVFFCAGPVYPNEYEFFGRGA